MDKRDKESHKPQGVYWCLRRQACPKSSHSVTGAVLMYMQECPGREHNQSLKSKLGRISPGEGIKLRFIILLR